MARAIARWLREPQTLHWRRALLQVHRWSGLTLGLYIVMISVSGSAIVAQRELARLWVPDAVPVIGQRMTPQALAQRARQLYPSWRVASLFEPRWRRGPPPFIRVPPNGAVDPPVLVRFERDGEIMRRQFDPYSGRDLGDTDPYPLRVLAKLVDLHDDLLAGVSGRAVNGFAGLVVALLFVSGAVLWWPGTPRWRASLSVQPRAPRPRVLWQLHSMVGFWTFALLLLWALSGVYLAFPEPFQAVIDRWFPPGSPLEARGYELTAWFTRLHFGRFGGWGVRITWIVLGLAPATLFVTGAVLTWRSTLRPWWRRLRGVSSPLASAGHEAPSGS